jgi:hypothetical protein
MDYFEEYREKIREIKSLEKEMRDLQQLISCKRSTTESLGREVDAMRRIITVMIDRGMDPVEAKLKTDAEDRQENMWRDQIYDHSTITASGGGLGLGHGVATASVSMASVNWPYPSTAITNQGAISTSGTMRITGAQGATGAYGAPGAYGSGRYPSITNNSI